MEEEIGGTKWRSEVVDDGGRAEGDGIGGLRARRGFGGGPCATSGSGVGVMGTEGGREGSGAGAAGREGLEVRVFFFAGDVGDGATAIAAAPARVTAFTSNASSSDAIDDNDVSDDKRVMERGPGLGSIPTKRAGGGM